MKGNFLMTKRILVFFSCVLCAVLLISCSQATPESSGKKDKFETEEVEEQSFAAGPKKQSVTDHALSVQIAGQEFAGYFTGTLNEGIPEGEGRFKAEKLIYKGTFQGIEADTGTVGGYPLTVQFSGSEYTGIYQGDIVSGKLTGTGSFTSENLLYDGSFENGVPTGTGSVTKLPVSIMISAQPLSGSYTGPITGFLPEGEGSFEADKTKYSGTFAAGAAQDGNASDLAVTIKIAETDYIGFYTGPVAGGALTGDGTFTADQLSYSGSFETGALKDGTLANFPLKVTVQGTEISGIYNGPVAAGALTGDASFTSDGLTYSGTFSSGAMTGDGTFSSITATISFQDRAFTGTYTGQTSAFLPNGEGSFEAPSDGEGYYLSFTGTFLSGGLGTGTLSTNHCTVTFLTMLSKESYTRLGTYSGTITDGILTGDGTFSCANDNQITYDETGHLDNGSFNGIIHCIFHLAEGDLVADRTFTGGQESMTNPSHYFGHSMITSDYGKSPYEIAVYNMIRDHDQAFFYRNDGSELEALVSGMTYDEYYSDPKGNAGKLLKVEGATLYSCTLWTDYPDASLIYLTLLMPGSQNQVVWLGLFGTAEEVTALESTFTKGQTISFIALPLKTAPSEENENYIYIDALAGKIW